MSGHVKFRHHPDAAIARVRDQFLDLFLRVVVPAGAHLVQFWELLALNPESLVLAQVEVEDIHLHRFHTVKSTFYDVNRHPVTTRIEQEPAPRESRSVFDVDCRSGKSLRAWFDKLQNRLQSVNHAEGCWRRELGAGRGYLQFVRLVFSELLYSFAGALAVDRDRCFVRLGAQIAQWNSCGAREMIDESLRCIANARIICAAHRDGESLLHDPLSRSCLDFRWHRHEIPRRS